MHWGVPLQTAFVIFCVPFLFPYFFLTSIDIIEHFRNHIAGPLDTPFYVTLLQMKIKKDEKKLRGNGEMRVNEERIKMHDDSRAERARASLSGYWASHLRLT